MALSRRAFFKNSAAFWLAAFASPTRAAAPPAVAITPALIAAAKKEGGMVWYTSVDLQLAEKVGGAFEQKFSGVSARVERAGGERIFSRLAQEYATGIHVADAVSTAPPRNSSSPGRRPLSDIKIWNDDPAAVEVQGDAIKLRYSRYFGV
jgi:iron(III) transport system substrate-binding protein